MSTAWPGGMRGAIESAALAVWQALACQIQSPSTHPQITSAALRPVHISPSGPAHSARPTQNYRPMDFVIFKKH